MSAAPMRHDVAIVGGGPSGLLLGCLLAMRGIRVVVFERRPDPGTRNRAIGIHAAALEVLDRIGIGAIVRAEAAVIQRGVASCRGRGLATLDLGDAPVRTLPQPRTEALLAARLAGLAPGALRRGETVTALRDGDEWASLRTESLTGASSRHLARYVVGADGARSTIRDAIGVGWRARGRPAHYAMADETAAVSGLTAAELHLEPDGVVERFPLPAAAHRWVVRLPRRSTAIDRDAFVAIITSRLGVGPARGALSEPAPFTARQHLARPFARGRVALLGDAAHELSPIGGQGMNLGWFDAVALDEDLAEALASGAGPTAFPRTARRRAAAIRAMRRAGWNTRLGAPRHGVGLRLRNALVRCLAARPLQGLVRSLVTIRG